MAGSSTRDWDASTYQRVALPHEDWARAVLDRLGLEGGDTVLDAGCGSGRTTSIVIERVPDGRVIAVDGSPSMVEKVKEVLRPQDTAIVSDLTKLELDEQVDAVFSTAVFHWITDHEALFARMRAALGDGGRFAAQCGGEGNIAALKAVMREVGEREPYGEHIADWRPWNYAAPIPTHDRLRRAGFAQARCWRTEERAEPEDAAGFASTVCLGSHLDRLPEPLRDAYVAEVLQGVGEPLVLEYVRLNIDARA